ncbi:MAG: hypothetical protein QX199_13870 [Methylococcaceae bacterium]
MINKKSLEYRQNIKAYLLELSSLINQYINESDISGLAEIEIIRHKASSLNGFPVSKFVISFNEKVTEKFRNFIDGLYYANDSEVYIWTKRTNICGLYKIESIRNINLDFPFEINDEGILVFLSADFKDKLLFDFASDSNGNKMLEIEVQGQSWPDVSYNNQ